MMQDNRKLLGIRISPGMHKTIKKVALDHDITIQDYILGLISEDIQHEKSQFLEEIEKRKKETI